MRTHFGVWHGLISGIVVTMNTKPGFTATHGQDKEGQAVSPLPTDPEPATRDPWGDFTQDDHDEMYGEAM